MPITSAPMGWNSWDCYGAAVDEQTVRRNAEYMAKNLKQYGYEYVVVDIQWYEPTAKSHRYNNFAKLCVDEYSRLIPAENRFPSSAQGKGFAPLADYVHSLGLKFGIHIMRGIPRQAVHRAGRILGTDKTARDIARMDSICTWNTDMYGINAKAEGAAEYYKSIFALYAEWGVDFIKCDDIARELPDAEQELIMISSALKGCGRQMVFSISPGPALLEKAELYKQTANMWRMTDDFWDKWEHLYAMFERCEKWCVHCGASHYPDADMLPIGAINQVYGKNEKSRFTQAEVKTMMSLWCIFRSPLMIGSELTGLDEFSLSVLCNPQILQMHRLSRHSHQVFRREQDGCELSVWAAHRAGGGTYCAVFNLSDKKALAKIELSELELCSHAAARELWSGDGAQFEKTLECEIEPHGARVYLFDESLSRQEG